MPTITICTTAFEALAGAVCAGKRMPDLPLVIIPHPLATQTAEGIEALARDHLEEVVRGLTTAT